MSVIISKEFNCIEILFSIDKDLYLHTTAIAKKFNKQPRDWLKTTETKYYIEFISKELNISKDKLVIVRQGGKPKEQGTWIHKKLAIYFARWLSVEFAVWSDTQIEEILKGELQISKSQKQTDLISVSTENMRKEIELLEFAFKNLEMSKNEKRILTNKVFEKLNFPTLEIQPKRKAEKVFTLTQLLEDFQISFSPYEMNLKLQSFGIIQKVGGYWFLKKLNFGVNESYENYKNPKYYKSTFQELLDIVL